MKSDVHVLTSNEYLTLRQFTRYLAMHLSTKQSIAHLSVLERAYMRTKSRHYVDGRDERRSE